MIFSSRLLPFAALLLPIAALAQRQTLPLRSDPSRVAAPAAVPTAQRTAALSLPFFDDFTSPLEGPPKLQNWLPMGGALANNRLAFRPLTRGTASLDGLRADGNSYSTSQQTDFGACDTLTSQPIDLGGRTATSNIYLSYAWQSGGVVGGGNANSTSFPVYLELQFQTSTGTWVPQHRERATGRRTVFKQRIQIVADARFLHPAFQFRFVNVGDRTSSTDLWNLDYIKLDANRSPADTTYLDIATGTGLSSPLRRFTAMPAYQFGAVGSTAELAPELRTDVVNLNAGPAPTPILWTGTVRELGGSLAGTWLQSGRPLPAVSPRRDTIRGDARRVPVPPGPGPRRLRYTLVLDTQERNPLTLPNDTTTRTVELDDYYAYDDGTPEYTFLLPAVQTGPVSFVALRFDLNRPDQVRAIRVAPVFTTPGNRAFTAFVWADNNGRPGAVLGSVSTTLRNPLAPGQVFVEVPFRQSIPVSGTFYIGYSQASTGQFVPYGLDLNNTRPGDDYLFQQINSSGAWETIYLNPNPNGNNNFPGAPMLRPVTTDNQTITPTRSPAPAASFALYPNPAHSTVAVAGPAFARARVFDALGRLRWTQPAAQAGHTQLTLDDLPAGIYLVQLTLADGSLVSRRLVVE